MPRIAVLATTFAATLLASVALATPTVATAAPAVTASTPGQHASAPDQAHKPKKGTKNKGRIKLSKSADGAQPGLAGIVITASKLTGSGKVTFFINGIPAAKTKAKKGKASFVTPSTLVTGNYAVTAKFKGKSGSTSFRVYNSAITLSTTSLTISRKVDAARPKLSGTVVFKDVPAAGGNVDIYQNGNRVGGSSSPDYLTFTPVGGGVFDFSTGVAAEILNKKNADGSLKYVVGGTYTFQAFYTPGIGFTDYIASNVITVTVTA